MEIEFDPAKEALNIKNHDGLSLSLAAKIEWENAVYDADNRFHYDEIRIKHQRDGSDG
jgi:uncharacterized DUF497 family protein